MKKICLVTYSDDIYRIVLRSFELTKSTYCKKHNIDFFFEGVSSSCDEKLGWKKINIALKYLLLDYDYVIITDYDSVIINDRYSVIDLIESSNNADIICSKLEHEFMLLGCCILKNTTVVKEMFSWLTNNKGLDAKGFLAEEAIFNNNLSRFPLILHVDSNINCVYNMHSLKNPFMLHYAGIENPLRIKHEHSKRYNTR